MTNEVFLSALDAAILEGRGSGEIGKRSMSVAKRCAVVVQYWRVPAILSIILRMLLAVKREATMPSVLKRDYTKSRGEAIQAGKNKE